MYVLVLYNTIIKPQPECSPLLTILAINNWQKDCLLAIMPTRQKSAALITCSLVENLLRKVEAILAAYQWLWNELNAQKSHMGTMLRCPNNFVSGKTMLCLSSNDKTLYDSYLTVLISEFLYHALWLHIFLYTVWAQHGNWLANVYVATNDWILHLRADYIIFSITSE